MSYSISIIGCGYVGCVTGACFADMGHNVTLVDVDSDKVDSINEGRSPIYEPGLEDLIQKNRKRIHATTDLRAAVRDTDITFIAVGFEKYRISVSPEKMHDLLYYATLLYGESATMASECAVLGTHAIFCDFAGRGYTDEEERDYGLVYNFKLDESSQERSIEKVVELLQDPGLKEKGREKQKRLLNDKIDVTAFMVWFIENYPQSVAVIKKNPDIQEQFK